MEIWPHSWKHPFDEEVCKFYFIQVLQGLKYLKDNKIIHRNLKPENILLTNCKKKIKINNFKLAKIVGNFDSDVESETRCGSPLYMSPEKLNELTSNGNQDVWASGIILFEMVFGFHPFNTCKDFNELKLESMEGITIPKDNGVSAECVNLLTQILSLKKRPSIEKILAHGWFKSVCSDVKTIKQMYNEDMNSPREFESVENLKDNEEMIDIEDFM